MHKLINLIVHVERVQGKRAGQRRMLPWPPEQSWAANGSRWLRACRVRFMRDRPFHSHRALPKIFARCGGRARRGMTSRTRRRWTMMVSVMTRRLKIPSFAEAGCW